MAKLKSIDSKAMAQFRASLLLWHESLGIQIQQSAARLGISHTLMSRIIHGKTGISMAQAENIAHELGKELVDMLEEGRKILDEIKSEKIETFTENQKIAINAFKSALLYGGEAAEFLAQNAIALAKKKQAEEGFNSPSPAKSKLSA